MSREKPQIPKQRKPCGLPCPTSSASFWHSEPSPLLIGHRSTRDLPAESDVVIIGSGMTGASIAHHLLNPGNDANAGGNGQKSSVVMLEAREACWGATGRNGGHCQPLLFEHPHDRTIGDFELANYHALQSMIESQDIDCEWVSQPGVRGIYSKEKLAQAEQALQIVRSNAPDLADYMRLVTDKAELAGKYRLPTADGAMVTSLAARMWPYKLVSKILENLLTSSPSSLRGTFNLQTLTPATGISRDPNGGKWQIATPRGTILTPHIALATNAYTSHLLPRWADLIVPCRGQMSALHPPPSLSGSNRLPTSYGFEGDGLDDYLIQRPNERGGHLMFGGGRTQNHSMGVTDDGVVDEATAKYLRRQLVDVFALPEGKSNEGEGVELQASHQWTGIMGFSRDDLPWIGPVPGSEGVFMAAGFTGHGMPNTWLSGKAVAEMIVHSLQGGDGSEGAVRAQEATGLPKAYQVTEERIKKAMSVDDYEAREWEEMERTQRVQAEAS